MVKLIFKAHKKLIKSSKLVTIINKNKEKLRKETRESYQNLSEEEKDKKRLYDRERCRNLSEEGKERSINMTVNDMKIF